MPRPTFRISPRLEERLFSAFLIAVLGIGAWDVLGGRSLSAALGNFGTMTALTALAVAIILLALVIFRRGADPEEEAGQTPYGLFLGLGFFAYPVLFWAVEVIPATLVMTYVALGLFARRFGLAQFIGAAVFTAVMFFVFFVVLGTNMTPGALIDTGLADRLPILRRDLFALFSNG